MAHFLAPPRSPVNCPRYTFVIVENHQPGTTKIWTDGTTLIGTKARTSGGRDQSALRTERSSQ
jgi:hypothetical protein